jgi:ribonuclease HI
MELVAVIKGLECVHEQDSVTVVTDSQYVKLGITLWIHSWRRNGWKTVEGHPVKNKELWEQLLALTRNRFVSWKWVKGHGSSAMNIIADRKAREMASAIKE